MVSRPRLHLPVQALVCVAAFGFGLPLAIALFPQTSEVRMSSLSNDLGPVHYTPNEFEGGPLFLCLDLPFTLIRHEKAELFEDALQIRSLKTLALRFSLERKRFENGVRVM